MLALFYSDTNTRESYTQTMIAVARCKHNLDPQCFFTSKLDSRIEEDVHHMNQTPFAHLMYDAQAKLQTGYKETCGNHVKFRTLAFLAIDYSQSVQSTPTKANFLLFAALCFLQAFNLCDNVQAKYADEELMYEICKLIMNLSKNNMPLFDFYCHAHSLCLMHNFLFRHDKLNVTIAHAEDHVEQNL